MVPKNKIKCPIAVKLTIPEYELMQLDGKHGSCSEALYTSWLGTLHTGDVKYRVGIYPNLFNLNYGDAWIKFELRSKNSVKGKFNISVASANYSWEKITNFIARDFHWFFIASEKLCTTKEFFDPRNRYMVNGEFTMTMDGYLMIEKEENDESWKYGHSGDSLCLALWEQESTKDFKFVVGKNEISAHKCVLSARSPVFTKMLESGMKETRENKVIIEDFPFDIVEAAIKLCYHRFLVSGRSLEDKMKIFQFLDKYDIHDVKDNLETYLITVVDETNVCHLANYSLLFNATKLKEKCGKFLRNCLYEKKPINDFDLLDKDFDLNWLPKNAFYPVSEYML